MNHYDHHQEEHRQRRRGATGTDYEPDYDLSLHGKKKSTKPLQPSFWLWIWVSSKRYVWLLATLILLAGTLFYFLACDGILVAFPFLSQEQLLLRSTVFGMISIADITLLVIAWRKYKYSHIADDDADSADTSV